MVKYKIVFVKKAFSALFVVRTLTVRKIEQTLSLGKKKYVLNVNEPCYISKQISTYFLDIDSGSQLNFQELKPYLNPDELDTLTENNMIAQITKGLMNNSKEKIIAMIMGVILGALIAALIAVMYYTKKIQEVMAEYTIDPNMLIPQNPTMIVFKTLFWNIFGG